MRKVLYAAVLFAASGVVSANSGAGPSYTIRFRPTVGKRLHYVMSMLMTAATAPAMSIRARFTMTATKHVARKYTVVTVIDYMSGVPGAQPNQVNSMLKGSKVTQVMDENGNIVSTKAVGPMKWMMQGGTMGSTGGLFPRKAVHVGDTWTGSSLDVGPKSSVRVKLLGVKSAGGKQVATLHIIPITQSPYAQSGPITVVVETKTGVLRSMEMSGAFGAAAGGGGNKVHITVKLA
ncbi:MAG: hypothetical protein ACYC96_10425 [Fimbriimonadaceae bacterium]